MSEIKNTLLDVRKSYRLLHDYQRSILDLVSFIGGKLSFDYQGGYVKFGSESPRNGKGSLKKWAWDWLNLYYYEFHFNDKIVNNNNLAFSIIHMPDSGYFEAKKNNTVHTTDTESFLDVEYSESYLIFICGFNAWGLLGEDNWKNVFLTTNESGRKEDNKGFMIFKRYKIEDLVDEISTRNILQDFQHFCAENQIVLPIIERDFN
ncbi:hypothetical protein [Chryseobacterium sp. 5_R23647]|uniref:hypothetical protein n=1 Tax=Chryseobacterium sp. 5_R23647 TaxID=2258964 RepID=UPI000E258067|nr:hypothetical protein [Chryseobacterium sp. 5_R23647]REC42580.1 hypothetical protein DRF69_11020 [Chryseobacterium sp. 5_R23647]